MIELKSTCFIIVGILLLCSLSSNRAITIDEDSIQQMFRYHRPAIFLLAPLNTDLLPNQSNTKQKYNDSKIIREFQLSAELYQQKYVNNSQSQNNSLMFVMSLKDDWMLHRERRQQFLGVYDEDIPAIVYYQNYTDSIKYKYPQQLQINAQNILQFIESVENGKISQFYKSEPIPEQSKNDNRFVKIIVGKNFQEKVLKQEKQYMIIFYEEWQYKNRVIKLQFIKAAQSLIHNKNIIFAKINAMKNQIKNSFVTNDNHTKNDFKIKRSQLPAIYLWKKNKSIKPIKFSVFAQYEYSFDFMIQWIKTQTEYQWVQPIQISSQANEQL